MPPSHPFAPAKGLCFPLVKRFKAAPRQRPSMIDPKQFYRKMDRMLARIASDGDQGAPLPQILDDLVASFGEELHFDNGHLYRELFGVYELLHATGSQTIFPARLTSEDPSVNMLLQHGSFVYENPWEMPAWFNATEGGAQHFVAFLLDGPPGQRYIMMFTLGEDWIRDEVAFCLNGARFALNYRLKSDAAQNEMATAAAIQRSLLPSGSPEFEGWDIAARTEAAEAVGGDLYDFIDLEKDLLGLAVGDASGHGLPAALLVRDTLMGIRMGVGINMKMIYTMKKLNRELNRTTFSTRFVSVFYAELDRKGGLLFANAGHTSGLVITEKGTVHLDPTGPIMGPLPDIPIERGYAHIPEGAILALYTDGITERVNKDGTPFEVEGLTGLIRQHRNRSASEIVWQVFNHVRQLDHESDMLEDDMTLMILKHVGRKGAEKAN